MIARAEAQHRVLRRADLFELGLGRGAIAARLKNRRLHRLFPGVYSLGDAVLPPHGRWLAGVWTAGGDATLSALSAGAFHGMALTEGDDVHVTTTGTAKSRPGLVVHRTRRLPPEDVIRVGLLRVTRIPRTHLDLADVLPYPDFRAILDAPPGYDPRALRAAQLRHPGRSGAKSVARALSRDEAHTRSAFERRYLWFRGVHHLPPPDAMNVMVAGHLVDVVHEAERMLFELDGRTVHARRSAMRADRQKDEDYQRAGWFIRRWVWEDFDAENGPGTAASIRAILAQRSVRSSR